MLQIVKCEPALKSETIEFFGGTHELQKTIKMLMVEFFPV